MDYFFEPKTIGVVGVSDVYGKVGYSLARKLVNKKGIFFVNLKRKKVFNKRCYPSLKVINKLLDLVIIAVPEKFIEGILEECVLLGIKNVIIITAGVSNKVIFKFKDKMNIIGSNCFGLVNARNGFDCTFAKDFPIVGKIGFISQSGALWSSIAAYSVRDNIGFSKFISLGDMHDIDFNDVLEYFLADDSINVVLLYIEALKDGRRFINLLKKNKKEIVILKGGKTEKGARAILSHTGSLAGSYNVYKTAIKQFGGYFAEGILESIDSAKFLSFQGKFKGKRVVILTNAGGPGVLVSDNLEDLGYIVVNLPNLRFNLPSAWSKSNPIDILGDAQDDRYQAVLDRLTGNFFDILIVLLTPQDMINEYKVAKVIVSYYKCSKKQIVCCFMGGEGVNKARLFLESNNIICFRDLERLIGLFKVLLI
ncbi:MAG TPA: CoA-binding protein [Candidatus Nanoarchaeia archaeon]|nr:CoA-binding protein [Candidatus Nanoarchaeia archaeon]